MSIQSNANALSTFSNVNFGREDAIANLGEGDQLDLTKDIPEITNVTFSQKFTSDIKGLDPKDYLFS